MADIDYRCEACGTSRTVSEFADITKIKCTVCGGTLAKANGDSKRTSEHDTEVMLTPSLKTGKLKVAKTKTEPDKITETDLESVIKKSSSKKKPQTTKDGNEDSARDPLNLYPKIKRKAKGANHTLLAFLLFGLIAAITGYVRYAIEFSWPGYTALPADALREIFNHSWGVLLLLNLIVVIKAMSENVFQGILCLLIPGWSFAYLLFMSDDFFLRAVIFGCLIGFGIDGGLQLWDGVVNVSNIFKEFIASGGS